MLEITNNVSRRDYFAGLAMHATILANLTLGHRVDSKELAEMLKSFPQLADELIKKLDKKPTDV